jgi:Sec-independent protein translocase protein TatA
MFGLDFGEFLILFVVVLVFINPKDLPKFIYQVGKIYGQIMEAYHAMTRQISQLGDQARHEIEQAKWDAEKAAPTNPAIATGKENPREEIDLSGNPVPQGANTQPNLAPIAKGKGEQIAKNEKGAAKARPAGPARKPKSKPRRPKN